MTSGHQYFLSKWYTSVQAYDSLHGGATNGLKSMTHFPLWEQEPCTQDMPALMHTYP